MSKSGNLTALAALYQTSERPLVYYSEDPPYLPRILVFYWPVQAVGSLSSTSRIRTTILSAAGFKSYAAFSVSPSSPYYAAVHRLPEEKQRDEVLRGIAFSLCRYFSEIPTEVKTAITDENTPHGKGPKWGQNHAAQIACQLNRILNVDEVMDSLRSFSKQRPSSPPRPLQPAASIRKTRPSFLPPDPNSNPNSRFGHLATPSRPSPMSQNRRTPSYSTPGSKIVLHTLNQKPLTEQLESLRFKMCEFVDTEDRYISRLHQLIDLVSTQGRTAKSLSSKPSNSKGQKAVSAMLRFPALLDQIKELNLAFLEDLESSLQNTEDSAMTWLANSQDGSGFESSATKDPVGAYAFAKVLLSHFPRFPMPYREYLDLHSQISSNLDQFLRDGTSSVQQAPSLLMEPAQRISRYGLYIDTMMPHIPPTSTLAIRTLDKARKIIAEICEMEAAAGTILDSLKIEHEGRRRALSPTKFLSTLTRSNGTVREAAPAASSTSSREAPRLLPNLTRSFSRKSKPRPLTEQDVEQASNRQGGGGENSRPNSSGTSSSRRPNTANSWARISTKTMPADALQALLDKAEEENYRLLQENAELKRQMRLCKCERV